MKELLIGFYDYPYYSIAYELENGELNKIELSNRSFRLINDYNESWYEEDYSEQERNEIKKLFSNYERVIVCEDGSYEVLV